MLGLGSARMRTALAIVATALAAASAEDLQGWRTPGGELYFGAEPPPGSTGIEAVHPSPTPTPTPTERVPAPAPATAVPQPLATPRPALTAEPTPTFRPAASPAPPGAQERRPRPESERLPLDASTVWQREPACGDIAAIRDARPTIDLEADRLTMSGEVRVGTGGPVKDVRVCLGGTCTLVAGGKALFDGDTARFTLTVAGRRPKGLTVECLVHRGR